ncbi:MAG: 2-oxo-4-hydroxy-4-carboxy-5-ureidoimidazoline decarboxylase [Xanthobacteraceae bacterium]|nr:2-oxo-4-hydroxy-4-carboxy-5-ureidoimidazoline decarboxylase [Xanthobacteraceae bacterium]
MTDTPLSLEALNAMPASSFVAALGKAFEHADWVAEVAAGGRPYPTVTALHEAMMQAVRTAPPEQLLAFIGGHPELGSRVKRADLTDHSKAEQGSLGLDALSAEEFDRFSRLNAAYREKFGFPFIICVRRHTRDSILRQFERRLANDAATEQAAALTEIGLITRLRVVPMVEGPGKPNTVGRLSTHVLDTVSGRPAPGVTITLHEIGASARGLLKKTTTNADGRTDAPLIGGEPLRIGTYELSFHIGDYFAKTAGKFPADPPFLDVVPIRFAIAEPEGHYHVPLLATPWSYTTYRGS